MRRIRNKKVLSIALCFTFILSGCSVSDTSQFPTEISKKSDTETITENPKEVLTFDSSSIFENDYFRESVK